MSTLKGRNLISITDFSKEEYIEVLDIAEEFEKNPKQKILSDKVVATLFFEPSTRTRLIFESAANQLGARIIGFSDPGGTSVQKGESLHDTIVMVSSYSDLIVMRNPKEGSSRYASEVASVPVINAGDGANQHPTQCMLDLYSIRKTQGKLDNLNIAMVGDLKYGRTVHSLVQAMCNFNATFHLVSPIELKLPSSVKMSIKDAGLKYYQYTDLKDVIHETYPDYFIASTGGTSRIDFVYASPALMDKVEEAYIIMDGWTDPKVSKYVSSFRDPSDHRPILVDFKF